MIDADELVTRACPRIGQLGHVFYFAPETLARGKELGLDGFRFYFLGRGGVLGDVDADVVTAAFGFFTEGLISKMWDSARERCEPKRAATEFMAGAADVGRLRLSGTGPYEQFCAAAETVADSADIAGLSLFAGHRAMERPADPHERTIHLLSLLREMRGSMHLAAVVACGVAPRVAHYVNHPDMYSLNGWDDDDLPKVSEADRANLRRAESITDALCAQAYGVLDARGRSAFLDGLDRIEAVFTED